MHKHYREEQPGSSPFFQEKLQEKESSFWRRHGLKIYGAITTILVFVLGYSTIMLGMQAVPREINSSIRSTPVGQSSQVQAAFTPFSTVTPLSSPAVSAGTVLCHADWSSGMGGWSGTADWKYISRMLVNDGTTENYGASVILAPCQFSARNYAVEAEIQYVRGDGGFGLLARGDGEAATGYEGWIDTREYFPSVSVTRGDKYLEKKDYEVNTTWHTYRLEVEDEKLRLFIDTQKIAETTDTTYLAAGRTGLVVQGGTQINVKSFQVTAL